MKKNGKDKRFVGLCLQAYTRKYLGKNDSNRPKIQVKLFQILDMGKSQIIIKAVDRSTY